MTSAATSARSFFATTLIVLIAFGLSLAVNLAAAIRDLHWAMVPAALAGWYLADLLTGLVHMYMDYRPCPAGRQLDRLFFYPGSRESDEYRALFAKTMAGLNPFERLVYDFKNHHPRPAALGRRSMWRQIGSTVIAGTLPLSLSMNMVLIAWQPPGWFMAGFLALLLGASLAQYFHGTLHRDANPWIIRAMRAVRLLMTAEAHQLHHATLQRDFATNCGWSNPVVNMLFRAARRRGHFDSAGLEPGA